MELTLIAKTLVAWVRPTALDQGRGNAQTLDDGHPCQDLAGSRSFLSRLVLVLSSLAMLWGSSAHSAMVFGYGFHQVMMERALIRSTDADASVVRKELSIYVKVVPWSLNRLLSSSERLYRSMPEHGGEKEVKDAGSAVIEAYVDCVARMWEIRLLIERLEKDDGVKLPSHVLTLGRIVNEETELADRRGLSINFYKRNDAAEQTTVESSLSPRDVALENLRLARLLMACIGDGIVRGEIPLKY